jgi:hypothetical protein
MLKSVKQSNYIQTESSYDSIIVARELIRDDNASSPSIQEVSITDSGLQSSLSVLSIQEIEKPNHPLKAKECKCDIL